MIHMEEFMCIAVQRLYLTRRPEFCCFLKQYSQGIESFSVSQRIAFVTVVKDLNDSMYI